MSPYGEDDRLIIAEAGDVDAECEPTLCRRLDPPDRGVLDQGEPDDRVLGLRGEVAADAHLIEWRRLTPLPALFLDPLPRGEAGNHVTALLRVPRLLTADVDDMPELALRPEGVEEGAARARGVAEQDEARAAGAIALDRLEDLVRDAGCLVQDEEQVGARDS